jgi:type II secretory pathway pseudopilin PulG
MKRGGDTRSVKGFTVVETLIVLAVTSALFLLAATFINGRQSKTEFAVGIRQMQLQMQDWVNQVQSGYYNGGGFSCSAGVSAPLRITPSANAQGTNGDCMFIGKVIVASLNTPGALRVYDVAGRRQQAGLDTVSLYEAWPTAISRGAATNTNAPNSFLSYTLQNGLTYYGRQTTTTSGVSSPLGPNLLALAVLTDFYGGSASTSQGGRTFHLYTFTNAWGSTAGNPTREVDAINGEGSSMPAPWGAELNKASFCFASGGTNQSGLITVGDTSAAGTSVRLDIKSGKVC